MVPPMMVWTVTADYFNISLWPNEAQPFQSSHPAPKTRLLPAEACYEVVMGKKIFLPFEAIAPHQMNDFRNVRSTKGGILRVQQCFVLCLSRINVGHEYTTPYARKSSKKFPLRSASQLQHTPSVCGSVKFLARDSNGSGTHMLIFTTAVRIIKTAYRSNH